MMYIVVATEFVMQVLIGVFQVLQGVGFSMSFALGDSI